jgi:opacity protein-like surface antigen
MRTALAALVCVLVPGLLHAQSDVPQLPRNDVTVSTGLIDAQYRQTADVYERWHGSVFGGINFGHYWTDHYKTEVEAGWLSTAKSHSYESVPIGADRAYVQSDYLFKDLRLSLSQLVQFGRNEWIHPFIGAGVDIDYLRTTEDRPPQMSTIFVSNLSGRDNRSVFVPGLRERETAVRGVPFAKGGFKIYVSDRGFLVQEFKLGFTDRVDHVLWKTGVGIDF